MSGKQLDDHIRAMLKNYRVPLEPDWDAFEHEYGDELGGDDLLGGDMINDLKQFEAEPVPGDWDVLSSMLDHEDALEGAQFDTEIRKTVDRFEAPYEPHTWPLLERKLTAAEIRRRRILITKVLEVASILLLLFTFYNFYPEIRAGLFNNPQDEEAKSSLITAEYTPTQQSASGTQNPSNAVKKQTTGPAHLAGPGNVAALPETETTGDSLGDQDVTARNDASRERTRPGRLSQTVSNLPALAMQYFSIDQLEGPNAPPGLMDQAGTLQAMEKGSGLLENENQDHEFSNISTGIIPPLPLKLHVPLFNNHAHQKLYGGAIQPDTKVKPSKRIGIYASTGINVLHFPADNFFSGGEQITFNAQDLPALGFGGGFSIGWFGRRFGFETGLQYSNKSFKPGRQLLIGESLENSKVDFQAVQVDLVTVPLTLIYQIKPTGKFRFYTLGGIGFNLIAQAHYDLKIENNYPLPLSITQSASALASNREAHRIREHILDGATFKSKTHITAIVGFGLENYISHNLSLFVQPAYAHQIPLDRFSNNNGKNFKNLNIRFGARTTIH